jgi:hypothetical protein
MWTAEWEHQREDEHHDSQDVEHPDQSEERNHDLPPAVMADEPAQPQKQRCGEKPVRSRNHEPHPPEPVPQQIPVRMPADERQRNENSGGGERERRRIVTCLARRSKQTLRVRRDRGRLGRIAGLRHPRPE